MSLFADGALTNREDAVSATRILWDQIAVALLIVFPGAYGWKASRHAVYCVAAHMARRRRNHHHRKNAAGR